MATTALANILLIFGLLQRGHEREPDEEERDINFTQRRLSKQHRGRRDHMGDDAQPSGPHVPDQPQVPSAKTGERRLWDMVLFSEADRELAPLRILELAGKVDVIVFAETEFRFADGEPKPSAFDMRWLELGPHVRYYRIRRAGIEACLPSALRKTTHVHDTRLFKRKGLASPKCRESFGRNALTQAFVELGGATDDVVMISDADEMPRAAAMDELRKMASPGSRTCVHLGAVHHFKYTVRCERG